MKYKVKILSFIILFSIILSSRVPLSLSSLSMQIQPQDIIDKIQAFDSKLKAFKADFQEIRHFAYDPEKEVLSGKLYYAKPSCIRWDYLSPSKKEMVLTEKKGWIYIPDINQVQLFNIKGKVKISSLPIGLRGPSKDIRKNYQINISEVKQEGSAPLFLMELLPREGSEASVYYTYIRLWLRSRRWIPAEKIELKEIAGDTVIYQLNNIEINPKLSSKLFDDNFPADVEIVNYELQRES